MLIRKYLNNFLNSFKKNNYLIKSDWIIETRQKKLGVQFHSNDIETLIIGSSHGAYAFNPQFYSNKAFNLCTASQDLYYSNKLYELYQKKLTKLKTVILFYSVFSPGFSLNHTIEHPRCVIFRKEFGIDYQIFKDEFSKYENKYPNLNSEFDIIELINFWGYDNPSFFFSSNIPITDRVKSHLRENQRLGNHENKHLISLINGCKLNNHKLIVVITPARTDYKNNLPSSNELFKSLFDLNLTYKFDLINLYDLDFGDELFGDSDHMNTIGAQNVTHLLNKKILNL